MDIIIATIRSVKIAKTPFNNAVTLRADNESRISRAKSFRKTRIDRGQPFCIVLPGGPCENSRSTHGVQPFPPFFSAALS